MKPLFLVFLLSAHALPGAGTDPRAEALRLQSRASQHIDANRIDDALRDLGKALPLARRTGDVTLQASILTKTGSTQLFLGDYGAAATSLENAIALYAKAPNRKDEGLAWARLTQAYIAMGAFDGAAEALQKARELGQTTHDPVVQALADAIVAMKAASDAGPTTAFLWSFDKKLDLLAGGRLMFDQFWPMLNVVLMIAADPAFIAPSSSGARINNSVPMMTSMLALMEGRTLFEKGKLDAARERWLGALDGAASSDIRSGLLASIGATYLKQGNTAEAIRWFASAADGTETALPAMRAPDLLTSYLGSERRWYHDITIEALLQNGRPDEAFDYSERARARAFLQLVGNRRIGWRAGAEPLIREAETLRARIAQLQRRGRVAKNELVTARKAYENVLVRLRSTTPEYASVSTIEPVRIDDVRKQLPRGTTLISYFVSTYGVRAWVIDAQATRYTALPIDRATLDRTICWAQSLRSGGRTRGMQQGSGDCQHVGTAEESYDLLFRPLRPHVRNERLIIVPHGELHYVPFAALRDSKTGRYLIETHTVTLSPSASALRFLGAKETRVDGRTLVLGNPRTALGELPGSEREAAAVARAFQTTAKLGALATEDSLYALGGKVDLIHIAAHGVYDAAHPLFSYIALSTGAKSDGKLEVHEILGDLDLGGVNLVVLSSCQSASGKRGGGDDIVGLTRAILYAGTPGIISTLWDIDDEASARLMETFYSRLRAGDSAAESLRVAQRAMLTTRAYAAPQFWAAFTITGDPRGRWSDPASRPPSVTPAHPRR